MTCTLRVEMVEEKGFSEEENAREGLSTNERDDWFLNFREVLGLQKKNSACFRSALALTALASEKANKKTAPLLNTTSTTSPPLLLSMARGRGRGRGRGRVRSEKDLSADEGTSSSDDDAGDVLGATSLISSLRVLSFLKALSRMLSRKKISSRTRCLSTERPSLHCIKSVRKSWIEISQKRKRAGNKDT